MRSNRVFTDEQEQWIYDNAKGIGNVELANKFNERFGEQRKPQQIQTWKKNHNVSSGLTGWFEKAELTNIRAITVSEFQTARRLDLKKGIVLRTIFQ